MRQAIIALAALLVLIAAAGMTAASGEIAASRAVPDGVVEYGSTFEVSVTVDVDESAEISNYKLVETISEGIEPADDSGDYFYDEDTRTLSWLVIDGFQGQNVEDTTHTYTLRATRQGKYLIYGYLRNLEGSIDIDTGMSEIIVRDDCVEDWSCGEWSTCVEGIQERECTDLNACEYPISRPDLRQDCVVAVDSGGDDDDDSDEADESGDSSGDSDTQESEEMDVEETDDNSDDVEDIVVEQGDNEEVNEHEPSETKDSSILVSDNESEPAGEMITGNVIESETVEEQPEDNGSLAADDVQSKQEEADVAGAPLFTRALVAIIFIETGILIFRKINGNR